MCYREGQATLWMSNAHSQVGLWPTEVRRMPSWVFAWELTSSWSMKVESLRSHKSNTKMLIIKETHRPWKKPGKGERHCPAISWMES